MGNTLDMISPSNIAIFASGNGSNAEKLIKKAKDLNYQISCLICDNPKAGILKKNLQIPVHIIPYDSSKNAHENEILNTLRKYQVNWIFLAGYMRILSKNFIDEFSYKDQTQIINIHPSLLPKYRGLNAYEKSYYNGDMESGITIHYVDSGIDTGNIILQGKFKRKENDNLSDFIQRGQELEHTLYPKILERVIKYNY